MCIGSAEDFVSSKFGGDKLADNVAVGKADYKAVFGSIIFVLGLSNELLASL
jgi:hypothetical protein